MKSLWMLLGLATTANVGAAEVTVSINGVSSAKGHLLIAICDQETFLKRCAHGKKIQASEGTNRVEFDAIPAGTLAVSVIHDENSDGRLDKNGFGIPTEGYGFSRDAKGTFGPPKFDAAAIDVIDGLNAVDLTITY